MNMVDGTLKKKNDMLLVQRRKNLLSVSSQKTDTR
jgi:hypothetical protein